MKIIIPVDEDNMETDICISFGRAPYFLVFDTENQKSRFIENTAAASTGGAGIKAAQTIVDNKADVLLTPRCGENAAVVLKAADIRIFKTIKASAKENISAYIDDKLEPLIEIHAGFHGHGGG